MKRSLVKHHDQIFGLERRTEAGGVRRRKPAPKARRAHRKLMSNEMDPLARMINISQDLFRAEDILCRVTAKTLLLL